MEIYGLIYKATNLLNNKIYIGQTRQKLYERKSKHKRNALKSKRNTYFYNAIRKYGWRNFKWEILGYTYSKEELIKCEIEGIKFYNSNNKIYGYNSTKGGEGLQEPSEEVIEKLKKSGKKSKGRIPSKETRNKISLGLYNYYTSNEGPNKDRKFSKESKLNMSNAQKRIWSNKTYRNTMLKKRKEAWTEDRLKKSSDNMYNRWRRGDFENRDFCGGKNPTAKKVMINNIVYDCIKDAAIDIGIKPATLYGRFRRYEEKGEFPNGWKIL